MRQYPEIHKQNMFTHFLLLKIKAGFTVLKAYNENTRYCNIPPLINIGDGCRFCFFLATLETEFREWNKAPWLAVFPFRLDHIERNESI